VDGYWYNGKALPIVDKIAAIAAKLPSVERVVVIPYLEPSGQGAQSLAGIRNATSWDDFVAGFDAAPIDYVRLPFDHPLYILYSSGTTGVPKCIVHGAGGTLLQHLKEHTLHGDIKPGDRLFYFTTCGWMMWNNCFGGLAAGAAAPLRRLALHRPGRSPVGFRRCRGVSRTSGPRRNTSITRRKSASCHARTTRFRTCGRCSRRGARSRQASTTSTSA
jgi:acyl-coenzyme A synthetase/AMP-(fatty) acid ligase